MPLRNGLNGKTVNNYFNRTTFILMILIISIIAIGFTIDTYYSGLKIGQSEIEETVVHLEETFLRNTINNLISSIDTDRTSMKLRYIASVDSKYDLLSNTKTMTEEDYINMLESEFGLGQANGGQRSAWLVLIWRGEDEAIYLPKGYQGKNIQEVLREVRPLMHHYREIENGEISCFFGMTQDHIEDVVKTMAADKIRNMYFDQGSYIWVNEVVDYDGGTDYAIRRVHPNLPETEGMYLSTDMEDIKGNLPYLEELEGINDDGEIFFSYYFKELDSDIISRKFTYAKLYEKYDWIIAMGVQENEIEEHVASLKEATRLSAFERAAKLGIILVGLLILLLIAMYLKERHEKDKLEKVANTDILTNAKSRRFGESYLRSVMEAYKLEKQENHSHIGILMLDIDKLKRINDTYGHTEGDRVIRTIVAIVSSTLNVGDEIFRYGGDEFVAIVKRNSEAAVKEQGRLMIKAIDDTKYQIEDEDVKLKVSLGITFLRDDDENMLDPLNRSDQAMYLAKKEDGNHLVVLH